VVGADNSTNISETTNVETSELGEKSCDVRMQFLRPINLDSSSVPMCDAAII